MTITREQYQEEPLAITNTTIYTCTGTAQSGSIVSCLASNTTDNVVYLIGHITQSGTGAVDGNEYLPNFGIPPQSSVKVYPLIGEDVGPGDSVVLRASATGLNVRLSIKETSL